MNEQKLGSELYLSLSLSVPERMSCPLLCSGYDPNTDYWKLILLYQGSLAEIAGEIPFSYIPLLGRFAIIRIASAAIEMLLEYPQVLYLELSRPLYLSEITGSSASCLNPVPYNPKPGSMPGFELPADPSAAASDSFESLTGRGTAVAVIDSGVDFHHPDFRYPDGRTRILSYWDQSLPYDGKNPYLMGHIFSEEDLNRLLTASETASTVSGPVPSPDLSGHGTHVAGICAGNGRSSGGRNHGAAPEASLLVVKLKNEASSIYTDYACLMMAVDFVVRFAAEAALPLSVNISYGSNDGPHDGSSLIEQFFSNCLFYGKNVITVATGNEGLSRRHSSVQVPGEQADRERPVTISFTTAPQEQNLYLELWKSPVDHYEYQLISPSRQSVFIPGKEGIYRFSLASNQILASITSSTPYQTRQELFISLGAEGGSGAGILSPGTWQLLLYPLSVRNGQVDLWLPPREATNSATGFLDPSTQMTMTIPSTAANVISVSGYDSSTDTFASFSGQGFSPAGNRNGKEGDSRPMFSKPDLCAPAVNILSTSPGGGYSIRTGTSMAAPFVAGTCALLMEWGILLGHDPFLYGDKVKAALWKGSKALPAYREYPNAATGWGKLCARASLPDQ